MFYILVIIDIIMYLISLIKAVRNKQEKDYRAGYIIYNIAIITAIICFLIVYKGIDFQEDYIENLETKVNILTNYDEYCLEDSLRQCDVNE